MTGGTYLPANVDAERSILGCILLDPAAYVRDVAGRLRPEHFSLDSHRRIFAAMESLAKKSFPIDTVTLLDELQRRNESEAVRDYAYISDLLTGVPDRPSIAYYVTIVKEKSTRRELLGVCQKLMAECYDSVSAISTVLAGGQSVMRRLMERHSEGQAASRINTWEQIPRLDQLPAMEVAWIIEGMVPTGSVVLWAGESGSYKTWLGLVLANAVQTGTEFLGRQAEKRRVLYLDRENPLALIRERCSVLSIQASEHFRIWGGWQQDPPPAIGDGRLLELAQTTKPLIVVDSLRRFHDADENSSTEMARVMGDLRALANAGATVVAQHHKGREEGSDYRGSSDIKAAVDIAFAVSFDRKTGTVELRCFKNRYGEELTITVRPRLDIGRFEVEADPAIQRDREEVAILRRIIDCNPGVSQTEVLKLAVVAGLPYHRARVLLERYDSVQWLVQSGDRNRLDYYPISPDSSFSAFHPYRDEKLKSSNPTHDAEMVEGEL